MQKLLKRSEVQQNLAVWHQARLIGILDEIIVRMVVAYTLRTAQFWRRRQGSYVPLKKSLPRQGVISTL